MRDKKSVLEGGVIMWAGVLIFYKKNVSLSMKLRMNVYEKVLNPFSCGAVGYHVRTGADGNQR